MKQLHILVALMAAILLYSCTNDTPQEPQKSFEDVAGGRVWKIVERSVVDSQGNEFKFMGEGGNFDKFTNYTTAAFFFDKGTLLHFCYLNDGLDPYGFYCNSATYTIDDITNSMNTWDLIVECGPLNNSTVEHPIKIVSFDEHEIILNMYDGCVPLNFPDYDWKWPNPDRNPKIYDTESYARYRLEPAEDIDWLRNYKIAADSNALDSYKKLFGSE